VSGEQKAPKPPRILRTLVRFLLRLYSEDVGGITRTEMEGAFFDRHRARPSLLRELGDLIWNGSRERWENLGGVPSLTALGDDLRFGVRTLSKNRAFSLSAVTMLALGIGVNTSMFSMNTGMSRIVQRFQNPEELAFVWGVQGDWDRAPLSAPDYFDYRDQAEAFSEMGFYRQHDQYLTGQGEPSRLVAVEASQNLLPMLGLTPEIGRLHGPGDELPTAPPVAVLTHRLWQERFGGEEAVLGQAILLNDLPHTVIGVLPEEVEFEMLWRGAGVFTPLVLSAGETQRGWRGYRALGRLADGVSVEQAEVQMAGIATRLAEAYPETNEAIGVRLETFEDFFYSADDKVAMGALLLAVVAVLLIACVNLANLLLAKGTGRQGEVAIRLAVGASRGRIARQLLAESLMLAFAAGALGLLLGMWGLDVLISSLPSTPFLREEVGLDPVLLSYTLGVSVAAALAFGLTPALMASRVSLGASIGEGAKGSSSSRGRKRFRSGILVVQLALTVPLVLSCIVGYRQVQTLGGLDFGFPTEGLLAVEVDLPMFRYPDGVEQAAFYLEAVDAVGNIPTITAAGAGLSVPLGAGTRSLRGPVTVEGQEGAEGRGNDVSRLQAVSPGYFRTLGVTLTSGRFFTPSDGPEEMQVGIVNERMAHHYWPGEDPVGKRLTIAEDPAPEDWITVVGMVANFGADFYGDPPSPTLYLSHLQRPVSTMILVARTEGDPLSVVPAVRQAVGRIDAGVPLSRVRSGDGMVDDWLRESRTVAASLGLLGILALGLAVVGLYGMVAYSVAQRTFEIGVRVVMGASHGAIRRTVMRSFLVLAGVGLLIGLAISAAAGLVMRSWLAFLQVPYASTVGGLVALLVAVVLVASYLPARRATSIEPVVALKCE
jgi:putative ABC transport system permease protein